MSSLNTEYKAREDQLTSVNKKFEDLDKEYKRIFKLKEEVDKGLSISQSISEKLKSTLANHEKEVIYKKTK